MTLEELIYKGTNTSGISNVSTRGQPTTSTFCKKDIKGSIKSAISENPSFKQFLEAIIGLDYMLILKSK